MAPEQQRRTIAMTKQERNQAIDQYMNRFITFSELEEVLRVWNAQVKGDQHDE
jgi:hypothetical protein